MYKVEAYIFLKLINCKLFLQVIISGVYIKFEIHIFAPPPFLDSYFFPKWNIL